MKRTAIISILDGNAAGCHECAVEGWMGVAFRIPRALLPDGKARKKYEDACSELTQSGVYFLFGKTEKGEKSVYVGKAERRIDPRTNETNGVLFRVMQRHSNKKDPTIADRWEEAVMIVSDNEKRLQMKHYIDFLENKFYRLAKNSEETDPHGYKVLNNSVPQRGDHTSDVDRNFSGFIECANTALIALGYYILEPLPQDKLLDTTPPPEPPEPPTPSKDWLLHMKYGKGEANGKLTSDGFVVLAGSKINPNTTRTCRDSTIRQREEHADKIRDNALTSDIHFKSSSAAASFVAGADISGNMHWRDGTGTLLGKLLSGKSIPHQPSTVEGRLLRLAYTPKTMKKTYEALGKYISDKEFILLKGSEFCPVEIPKCRDDVRKIRRKYADKIRDGRLISDIQFGSSSTAASFVCGAQRNGYTSWCEPQSKKKLGEILAELKKD